MTERAASRSLLQGRSKTAPSRLEKIAIFYCIKLYQYENYCLDTEYWIRYQVYFHYLSIIERGD